MLIMAGGKGKKLRPYTNKIPKSLLPVNGKPIIERIIITAKKQGVRNFVISINYLGNKIKSYLNNGNKLDVNIRYIKENIIKDFKIRSSDKPLKNIKLLDIGCGGGLLSEPMCRLGASVVGIDASKKNIEVAKFHAKKNKLKIDYKVASPEMLKDKKKFDVILNMEIVEHVNDLDFFIKESSKLLKKNGIMFIATLNKTLKSYVFAIVGAEYILKWLPIGTHDWEKFVKPSELIDISKKNNLSLKKLDGMNFNILDNSWKVTNDTSVNYITKFIKN